MQATAADLTKRFDALQNEVNLLNKGRGEDQKRIEQLTTENQAMQDQLNKLGVKPTTTSGEPVPKPPIPAPGPEVSRNRRISAATCRCCSTTHVILSG
jgi:conjugal transfer pilus assembly protein TraB